MAKLPYSFYRKDFVTELAIQLLGKYLYTLIDGELTSGIIVETEAYNGIADKASHAYGGRYTTRTQTMYEPGGISYVYLCYGLHHLFNVVTGPKGLAHAVLIRGVQPAIGLDIMLRRRNMSVLKPNLTAGPGALAKALGINKTFNRKDLTGDEIWIEDHGMQIDDTDVFAGPRIGVAYAQDHALLPWRYYIKGNKFVSKPHL